LNLHHRTVRHAALITCLVLPAVLLGALSSSMAQGGKKVETAGKKYKNVTTALKDVPADQLIPIMHKIDDSLNVKCDFCHVVNANHTGFELDTKPMKKKAREMIVMTGDIMKHQKTLDGKGSCFMCHHGSPEPAIEAPAGK